MIHHLNDCLNFRDASKYVSSFAMERVYRSIESYLRACGLSIEEIRDVRFKIQRR